MSAAIEAKAKEYATLIQDGVNSHIFDNIAFANDPGLEKRKESIRNNLSVTDGNISLSWDKDILYRTSGTVEPSGSYVFKFNTLGEAFSTTVRFPYATTWGKIELTIQEAFVSICKRAENYVSGKGFSWIDNKANFWNDTIRQWNSFLSKLNVNQKDVALNMFFLEKNGIQDLAKAKEEKKAALSRVESELSRLLQQERPADWSKEQVYKGQAGWRYPTISLFDDYYNYGKEHPGWVRFFRYNPNDGNCHFRTQDGMQRHAKQIWRYLPFTPYWNIVKDSVEKALQQKNAAQQQNP